MMTGETWCIDVLGLAFSFLSLRRVPGLPGGNPGLA